MFLSIGKCRVLCSGFDTNEGEPGRGPGLRPARLPPYNTKCVIMTRVGFGLGSGTGGSGLCYFIGPVTPAKLLGLSKTRFLLL